MIKIDHISFSYGEENENTGGVKVGVEKLRSPA